MKIIRLVLIAILLFVIITVVSFVYLKWWQALAIVLAMIVGLFLYVRYLIANIGKILGKAMIRMIEVKSKVLRGAEAELHAVEAIAPPAPTDGDKPAKPANYYRIEVTIKPSTSTGPMTHWDIDDLQLVSFDTPKTTLEGLADEGTDSIDGYALDNIEIFQDGQFIADEQGKHQGPQRFRAGIAVPLEVRALKFQYYAEQFGKIPLPASQPQLA